MPTASSVIIMLVFISGIFLASLNIEDKSPDTLFSVTFLDERGRERGRSLFYCRVVGVGFSHSLFLSLYYTTIIYSRFASSLRSPTISLSTLLSLLSFFLFVFVI